MDLQDIIVEYLINNYLFMKSGQDSPGLEMGEATATYLAEQCIEQIACKYADIYMSKHEAVSFKKIGSEKETFEMKEVQLYKLLDKELLPYLYRVTQGFGIEDRTGQIVERLKAGEKGDARLTEKEIKDYDPRFWIFADEVTE